MSSKETGVSIKFPGLLTLLGLLFITLKLTDHIDWSWWWVLSPFWAPFALVAFCMSLPAFAQSRSSCWISNGDRG